ncbi:hypothetical protein DEU56DRAFT_762190 [Suillus clintonianus]|uniref:uncharacterized protein n=1 Tax=Suillus clintonianus TaxID=1904413 RepID=UPI001B8602FE|nr:uncharacterized protein DEU56DRAFT_762190 [Suillus clintonianus]KAG2111449.1 hypothetical protein DEU56DRAFT_762190 [Suillus clintonianus]
MYSLREFLQDSPSHEHVLEHYQLPNVPVPSLTGAGDAFNPNPVAQPNLYYPTEPTFIFTPTQALSFVGGYPSCARFNQSPPTVEASPIAPRLNQSPPAAEASPIAPRLNQSPPAAEASPIAPASNAPASTGGEKRGCEPCEGEQSYVPTKCQKAKDGTRHRTASETMPANLQDGRGKRQRVQSKRAAEANNIGGPFVSRKAARK